MALVAVGARTAIRSTGCGSVSGVHVLPPSVERSSRPGGTIRQRTSGSGETTSATGAWRCNPLSVSTRRRAWSGAAGAACASGARAAAGGAAGDASAFRSCSTSFAAAARLSCFSARSANPEPAWSRRADCGLACASAGGAAASADAVSLGATPRCSSAGATVRSYSSWRRFSGTATQIAAAVAVMATGTAHRQRNQLKPERSGLMRLKPDSTS